MCNPRSQERGSVDVVGTGLTVLDRVYSDGRLSDEALGGSCGNVLISLAMLDRFVAPLLTLGEDDTGERLVHEFNVAGADTQYIHRSEELRSPVIAQMLDTTLCQHDFSFVCPETLDAFPRYHPVGEKEVRSSIDALSVCSVFYVDRLTSNIFDAMKTAQAAGAIVIFEPSEVGDEDLFMEALQVCTLLKYSADRLGHLQIVDPGHGVRIVTHGASGLEVSDRTSRIWSGAVFAPEVRDTCGAGDMVTVGLIDWLLSKNLPRGSQLRAEDLIEGVLCGQTLAAENCIYFGARGIFREQGAKFARSILENMQSKIQSTGRLVPE